MDSKDSQEAKKLLRTKADLFLANDVSDVAKSVLDTRTSAH